MPSVGARLWAAAVCLAVGAHGQAECSSVGGSWSSEADCCVCHKGYRHPSSGGEKCSECSEGYVRDQETGRCSNGRPGTDCVDDRPYPWFGCGGVGRCSPDPRHASRTVFPCVCHNAEGARVSCAQRAEAAAGGGAACTPRRTPRMMTTFPNEPTVGRPFSFTIVGCELSPADEYLVIPAFEEDGVTEQACAARVPANGAWVNEGCTFSPSMGAELILTPSGAGEVKLPQGRRSAPLENQSGGWQGPPGACQNGFLMKDLAVTAQPNGISEATFEGVTMLDGYTRPPHQYKVCRMTTQPTHTGVEMTTWVEIDAHNPHSDERLNRVAVSPVGIYSMADAERMNIGGAAGDREEECCDGLHLPLLDICIPVWLVVLLWLLPLCCLLCAMMMRKTNPEEDEKNNNKKYELKQNQLGSLGEFGTGAEVPMH
eukprot:TRINITY_DN32120_c0_g1_i1.p1 TRINITY_DN32120_c0_g1~~TRINITY_DN32120_c0_g1_i1.p1  ORF type:complete len:428 (+),score=133.09 TRINITY_DN32120_c0_g1_i1:54-1337(+)